MAKIPPKTPPKPPIDLRENDVLVNASHYKIRYHPYGASKDLFHCRDEEVLIVGPKGTGKSLSVLQKQHLVLSKYPGARGFMARKTRTSMTNSCLSMFQDKVLKPPDKVRFHKQDQLFLYPNGSVYAVIGFDNIDRLNSSEWDFGYIQEATEVTENDWEVAGACIRAGTVPYQQLIGDANPDKPTHWLKVRIDTNRTTELKSLHEDNPKFFNHFAGEWTPEGEIYMGKLKRLSGVRYKRLYLGEWAAAAGLIYDTYDPHVHLKSRNSLPVDWVDWPHYWAIDFGYTHPFVWQDWMESPEGDLYLNREIYVTKQLVEDLSVAIMELNEGCPVPRAVLCDHDAEGRAVFERHTGLLTLPAFKSIQIGIQAVQKRLHPENSTKIYILRDALVAVDENLKDAGRPYSTETEIDGYVWDRAKNELVNSRKDELPVDADNHGMDAMRYCVAFVDNLADDPEEFEETIINIDEVRISPF